MEHKISYDDEHQFIYQQIIGFFTTEDALYFGKKYHEQLEGKPYKQLIVDLREAGKMESRETRSVTNEMLNEAGFADVAFVGANAATRMIAKVLMKLGSLKAESNFFKDLDSAINWIKNRRI
ncbi:MAG: STAS/SEC14 domain-containing protein [Bacteroidota bacterium]|nr:STAS/SEC14 domain-containing protein [Bacteroidota bacterium]